MNPFSTRKKQFIALLIIIITGLSGKLFAQSDYPADIKDRIRKVENNLGGGIRIEGESPYNLQQRMKFYNIPGVSVAVISNFEIDWVKAYGVADSESKVAVNNETLFQAASISKSLNGVGAMILVQDKKLDLDKDINTYLVSWKFPYDSASFALYPESNTLFFVKEFEAKMEFSKDKLVLHQNDQKTEAKKLQ